MNNITILPSALFAPTSYFVLAIVQSFRGIPIHIETQDYFVKQTIRNRYKIYTSQGAHLLSVPLKSKSSKILFKDITIDYETPWQKEHLRTLKAAYSSTPFFEHYIDEIQPLFNTTFDSLLSLNKWGFQKIIELLDLPISITYTNSYIPNEYSIDYRLKRTELFFDLKANYYQLNNDRGMPFISNLSVLDILFNLGPEARIWLNKIAVKQKSKNP